MGDIADIFDTEALEPTVTIDLPPEKELHKKSNVQPVRAPAYTVLERKALTPLERTLFKLAIDKDRPKAMSAVLSKKFGISDASVVKNKRLSLNFNGEQAVELLQKRDES